MSVMLFKMIVLVLNFPCTCSQNKNLCIKIELNLFIFFITDIAASVRCHHQDRQAGAYLR